MKSLLLFAYELATLLLPFGAVCLLLNRKEYSCLGPAPRPDRLRGLLLCLFGLYIAGVFYVTGVATLWQLRLYGLNLNPGQINLVPFSHAIDPVGYVLNVVLFLPLGFLLPWLWPRLNRAPCVLAAGLSLSLLVEVSQLFNIRATDVDDLLLNTLGALLGFIAFRLFARRFCLRPRWQCASDRQPALCIGAMFAGHFLLFNELGLVRLLYRF